jgi:hypothetical protein
MVRRSAEITDPAVAKVTTNVAASVMFIELLPLKCAARVV